MMNMAGNNNSNSSSKGSKKRSAGNRPRGPCHVVLPTTLDLHGYRREGAMGALTSFLEGHRVAGTTASVQVVTGTGSHSEHMGGPVLRSAVQSLLERREMEYSRNTAGSYLVNAQSGQVWYSQQSTSEDTKVVLRDGNDDDIRIQQAAISAKAARNRQQQKQGQYVRQSSAPGMSTGMTLSDNTSSSARNLLVSAGPSLTEVVRSEAEWNRAKEDSIELARHQNKQNTKEERELRKVLSASEEELKRLEEEETELFDQAVALSKRGELLERRDDERLFQKALAESQREETLAREALVVNEQELEQAFQEALTMSLLEDEAGDTITDVDPHQQQDEEERMMQLALTLSLQ